MRKKSYFNGKLKHLKYFGVFFVLVYVFLNCVTDINGQDFGRVPINIAAKKPATVTSRPRPTRTAPRTQKVTTVVREIKTTKIVKVRTSNLTVSSQIGAEVKIELLDLKGNPTKTVKAIVKKDGTNDDQLGSIEFEGITPGKYRIIASLDGYDNSESEEITIAAEKTIGINLTLEPIKYDLIIQTNIREGEVRYAPARLIKTNSNGTRDTQETGGYCIAPIKNGVAKVIGLQKGYFNIDIRPSDNLIEYEKRETSINVPEELPEVDDSIAKLENTRQFDIDLEKKISTETFASSWTNADWVLPNGWRLGNSLKTNNTVGIALPRNEKFRYYANFEMISDVTSLDDKTVGFVFRAVDDKNYYLLQISGAKAPEPYVAKGFLVRNNQPEQIFSNPIPHFAKTIAAKKSFRVIIRGKLGKNNEGIYEVFIEDSETADQKPLGNIIDSNNFFKKGAVGIAVTNNSNFEVASFTVCDNICR